MADLTGEKERCPEGETCDGFEVWKWADVTEPGRYGWSWSCSSGITAHPFESMVHATAAASAAHFGSTEQVQP